jgi:hypothetical protein
VNQEPDDVYKEMAKDVGNHVHADRKRKLEKDVHRLKPCFQLLTTDKFFVCLFKGAPITSFKASREGCLEKIFHAISNYSSN